MKNLRQILIISFFSLLLLIFLIYIFGFRPKEEISVIPEILKRTQSQIEAFEAANPDEILNHPFLRSAKNYIFPIQTDFPKGKSNPFE
jgi:hypothetical protein